MQIKKSLKKVLSLGLVFGLVFLQSCMYRMKASYKYSLENVETEEKIKVNKTENFLIDYNNEDESKGISPLKFEDAFIKIKWNPTPQLFNFVLENKLNSTIKIIWDSAIFIDYDGASYRVMNKNKKLNEDEGPTVPTPIIKKGFIEDLVYPVGFSYYSSGFSISNVYVSGRWNIPPLLIRSIAEGTDEVQGKRKTQLNNKYLSKYFKILLPIEINGKIKEYIFYFKIEEIIFDKL